MAPVLTDLSHIIEHSQSIWGLNLGWQYLARHNIKRHTYCNSGKQHYCDVPGSPCLSKKGQSNVRFVPFKFFYPWPRVLSPPERFVGDPASLARGIILVMPSNSIFDVVRSLSPPWQPKCSRILAIDVFSFDMLLLHLISFYRLKFATRGLWGPTKLQNWIHGLRGLIWHQLYSVRRGRRTIL